MSGGVQGREGWVAGAGKARSGEESRCMEKREKCVARQEIEEDARVETVTVEAGGSSTGDGGAGARRSEREPRSGERKGRPTNAERLARERTQSCGSILEFVSVKRKRGEISPESVEQKLKNKRSIVEEGQTNGAEREAQKVKVEKQLMDLDAENMEEQWKSRSEKEIMIELLKRFNEEKENTRKEMEKMKEELLREINYKREEDSKFQVETKRRLDKLEESIENSERLMNKEGIKNRLEILEARTSGGRMEVGADTSKAEKQIQEIRSDLERKEREERKLNVVIKGMDVGRQYKNLENEIGKFLRDNIETEVEIKTARVINEGKMIQVKFRRWEDKDKVMQNKRRLGNKKIYIDNDRTKKEREIQKKIVAQAKKYRLENRSVQIKFWKLKIEDKWYKWNETEELLEEDTFFREKERRK